MKKRKPSTSYNAHRRARLGRGYGRGRAHGKRTLKQTIASLLGNKMLITEIKQTTLSQLKESERREVHPFFADNRSLTRSF